jgi:peptidoglycan/xylan/chitin deacetylase (PgdA/CDA1 family)
MMRSHNKWLHRDHSMVQPHNKGRLRDWVKLGLAAALEGSGVAATYRALRTHASGARIHVLGYHRVVERIEWDGPVNPSLCITAEAFAQQMEQLCERFVVLPLSYVMRAVAGEIDVPHDAACVTFDDGYRDVLLRAHPILKRLGIPAAVFVPTGFDSPNAAERILPHDRLYAGLWAARRDGLTLASLADDETALLFARADAVLADEGPAGAVEAMIRGASAATLARAIAALESRLGPPALDDGAPVLTPEEVRALADGGWEIGAHTVGHVVLTHEPIAEARRQLATSKAALESWSGKPCRYFAYCNGYHSPALVEELKRAGYEGAVTTCDRPNVAAGGDPFRVTRKVLWEAHARGPHGRFSPAISAANLHDLFGVLGLTAPVDGAMEQAPSNDGGGEIVQLHNKNVQTHHEIDTDNDSQPKPTEVELAY